MRNHAKPHRLLRLTDHRRMAKDIEFLPARSPRLFLGREGRVEGFDSSGILTAIGGGAWNIHPLSAVKRTRCQFTDEKRCREVAVHSEAEVLLFTAHKSASYVVSGISEVDVISSNYPFIIFDA